MDLLTQEFQSKKGNKGWFAQAVKNGDDIFLDNLQRFLVETKQLNHMLDCGV